MSIRSIAVATALTTVAMLPACADAGRDDGQANDDVGSVPIEIVETPTATTRYRVPTSGMEPTLHCAEPGPGCEAYAADIVVVEEPAKAIDRGDIVVFETPPQAEQMCPPGGTFIKRVIGLPGESWEQRDGEVFIDGRKLEEPYVPRARRDLGTFEQHSVSSGHYFVMGDNRLQSCDSRVWGTVPRPNIRGRVVKIERPG